jgi:PAS domain S-box-containing protein
MNIADSKTAIFFERSTIPLWQRAVWLAMAYFACAEVSNFLSVHDTAFIYLWMPDGLVVVALLLNPRRDWLWLTLTILPVQVLFELLHGTRVAEIPFFYCTNMVQAVAGAWLVRRFVSSWPILSTLKGFFGFLGFAAILSPMLGATIGAATLTIFGLSPSFWQSWRLWWGANAMAVLVLSPFILAWFTNPDVSRQNLGQKKRTLEAVLLSVVFIALTWYLLFMERGVMSANKGQVVLPLLWAGLRFGLRAVTTVNFLLALALAYFTTQLHMGLTPSEIASGEYIFVLQFSIAMAALLGLVPAVILREREQAIVELRESEERFRNLTQAAFEGICISENGRILDVNNQLLVMFGCKERAEMIGRQIIEFVVPENQDSIAERIRAGAETIYGHRLLRKDGSSFFAEAQAKAVRIGNRNLRMTALRDITERKLAEEALRESEKKFRGYFEMGLVGMAISSPEKGLIDFNDRLCEIFGYTRKELTAKSWVELTHPNDLAADLAQFHRVLAGEIDGYELDKRFIRKDGGIVHAHISGKCLRDPGGQIGTLVAMVQDITARKLAEEALRASEAMLEKHARQLITSQEAERTRIAAELHDSLGQNLLLIKNRAQLALGKESKDADLRKQIEDISNLASQTIAEVRQISRDLHPPQLDHLGLTRALEAMINNTARASEITFGHKLDFVDDIFPKEAAMNLYRIVQESLNNILKHSRAKRAEIKLERDVHEVQLKITDDGCGFEPDGSGDDPKGLGLKNIAERVKMLGGKFKINSQLGKGACVEVTIPFSESE